MQHIPGDRDPTEFADYPPAPGKPSLRHPRLPGTLFAAIPPDQPERRCKLALSQVTEPARKKERLVRPVVAPLGPRHETIREAVSRGEGRLLQCLAQTAKQRASIGKILR